MISPLTISIIIACFLALLMAVAWWGRRRMLAGKNPCDNTLIYTLSLAIYCSSWTYYGSVGSAANSGMLFLTIYLGPTLAAILFGTLLRRLVRIGEAHHITSIADFISARHENSAVLAALVTIVAIVGISPYIALQLKAIVNTSQILVSGAGSNGWLMNHLPLMVVLLMIAFVVTFGAHRLAASEKHPGLVLAVAVQSVIKLVAFIAAGVFVTYVLSDGFRDALTVDNAIPELKNMVSKPIPLETWLTYLLLAASAFMFLPRQFHIAVVENVHERHLSKASWMLPMYLLLINLFVVPIAVVGLKSGLPLSAADTFVLRLPLETGHSWLALLVFIGGLSAAAGMVLISSLTIATMATNHLVMPLLGKAKGFSGLLRHALNIRRLAIAGVIFLGFMFERQLGDSHTLINMGMISFAAALQFAPPILLGMVWIGGNSRGAIMGVGAGFLAWFYTLLLPSLARSGWMSMDFVTQGPLGISWLRPENLLGLEGLNPLTHAVVWTMLLNICLYVIGSRLYPSTGEEMRRAAPFVKGLIQALPDNNTDETPVIVLSQKRELFRKAMHPYIPLAEIDTTIDRCLDDMSLTDRTRISILEYADLADRIERSLAGYIGGASAHQAFSSFELYTEDEEDVLRRTYGRILTELSVSPTELRSKIDYYRARDQLIEQQARELEEQVEQRTEDLQMINDKLIEEVRHRNQVEQALSHTMDRFTAMIDSVPAALYLKDRYHYLLEVNQAFCAMAGKNRAEVLGRRDIDVIPTDILDLMHESDQKVLDGEEDLVNTEGIIHQDGLVKWMTLSHVPLQTGKDRPEAVVGLIQDVTEQYHARQQLLQSDKLAAIGQLAAGVAHEINNPMGYITSNLNTMNRYLGTLGHCVDDTEDADQKVKLREIIEDFNDAVKESLSGAKRVKEIVADLKSFSRVDRLEMTHASVNECLRTTLNVVWNELKYKCQVEQDFGEVREIMCLPNQLNQVFLNILLNASQAMKESGGIIWIRTWEAEDQVCISVKDNGVGMPPDVEKRIFEPFYTTKDVGKGTGLGLSISYDIISQHKGSIEVRSTLGEGTEFLITLPFNAFAHSDSSEDKNEAEQSEVTV